MNELQQKQYFRKVKKHLKCSAKARKECLAHFKHTVLDYLEDCPDCTLVEAHQFFGKPEEVGQRYLAQLSDAEIKPYKTKKVVLLTILIITIIVMLFLFYRAMLWEYPQKYELTSGEIISTTNLL